jgi:hypothetical protein
MTDASDDLVDEFDNDHGLNAVPSTLWAYRRTILIGFGIAAVCWLGLILLVYARVPTERVSSLTFRLTFEGAERGQYPNGTKFSTAEIVSTPVLAEVFKANSLERYFPFEVFKDSVFVLQANHDLELLTNEYQAKLADPKLTSVDRARLEEDFRTKADSFKSAEFSLNLRRSERLTKMPDALQSKILQDTLSTWAQQAAERKGAVQYDIPVVSKNVLQKDFIVAEDYVVTVDILRQKIRGILKTLAKMQEIPGASAVRMGPEQIGLADLIANLEDLERFKVEPLTGVIRTSGLSRNPGRMDEYFGGRLLEVQIAQAEATQRIKSLEDALRDYEERAPAASAPAADARGPAVTPQLSESFIDKLVDLSTRSVDIKYRQDLAKRIVDEGLALAKLNAEAEYYQSMQRSFASVHAGANEAVAADVSHRTMQAFDELVHSMDQVQALYKIITEQNLNPNNVLYSITTPFTVRSTSALSLRTLMLYLFVALLGSLIVISLACLAHAYFRGGERTPPAAVSSKAPRGGVADHVARV